MLIMIQLWSIYWLISLLERWLLPFCSRGEISLPGLCCCTEAARQLALHDACERVPRTDSWHAWFCVPNLIVIIPSRSLRRNINVIGIIIFIRWNDQVNLSKVALFAVLVDECLWITRLFMSLCWLWLSANGCCNNHVSYEAELFLDLRKDS